MARIGDDEPAIRVEFESRGPAIVFDDEIPFSGRRDAKNPAEGNIGHPQITLRIKACPVEKTVNVPAVQFRFHPWVMRARFVQVGR